MISLRIGTLLTAIIASGLPCQGLSVERRGDVARRDALVEAWSRIRVDIERSGLTPKALAEVLADITGHKVPFVYVGRGADKDAIEPFDLSLRRVSVPSLMAIVAEQTDLAFVYRDRMVLLMPEDKVKPAVFFKSYDLRAATMRLRNFPGPRLGLPARGEERVLFPVEEEETDNTPCGMTADQLEEAIRSHVTPEAWDDKARISHNRGVFFVTHTPEGHAALQKALVRMGAVSAPRQARRRTARRRRR